MGLTVEAPKGYVSSLPDMFRLPSPPDDDVDVEPDVQQLLDLDPHVDEQLAATHAPYQPPTNHGSLWEASQGVDQPRNDTRTPTFDPFDILGHNLDTLTGRRPLVTETKQRCEHVDCYRPMHRRVPVWQTKGNRARKIRPWCGRTHILTDDIPCPACALRHAKIEAEAVAEVCWDRRGTVQRHRVSWDPSDPQLSRKAHDRLRKQVKRAGGEILYVMPQAHLARKVVYTIGLPHDPLAEQINRRDVAVSVCADVLASNGGRAAASKAVRDSRRDPQNPSTAKSDNWKNLPALEGVPDDWILAVAGSYGAQIHDWRRRSHPFDPKRVIELVFASEDQLLQALSEAVSPTPDKAPL